MIKYIITYLIGGILGYFVEQCILKKQMPYGDTLNKFLGVKLPFIHIWGLGLVILMYLNNRFNGTMNVLLLSLITGISLSILECIVGNISLIFNGYKTWSYNDGILPFCKGYASLDVTICWIVASLIFFYSCNVYKKYDVHDMS